MQTSFELRPRCNTGLRILHIGHYSFTFQGTLAGAICNKHTRARHNVEETIAVQLGESARIRQQLLAVLGTQDIFFFSL